MAVHLSFFLFALLSLFLVHSHSTYFSDCSWDGACTNDREQHEKLPEQWLSHCLASCPKSRQSVQCEPKCIQEYEKIKQQHPSVNPDLGFNRWDTSPEDKERETRTQSRNPFYFSSRRFKSRYQSEHGHIRVLKSFSETSDILRGIGNYRLRIFDAEPQTVFLPHHTDVASLLVVVEGEGMLMDLWPQNGLHSFKLSVGQFIRVPAGAPFYFVNHHRSQRLRVVELLITFNVPGRFGEYFPVGEKNPESYLMKFPKEILEAAFNAKWNDLQTVFERTDNGVVLKMSEHQMRSMIQESRSESKREELWTPINIKSQRKLASNKYGEHFEASPENNDQLRDINMSVGLMNLTEGAMTPPYFNSEATKIVYVRHGEGKFFVVTPYLKRQEQSGKQSGVQYEMVEANIKEDDVFVLPVGHPIVIVASPQSKLELLSFGIGASFNQKYFLAGGDNMWNELPTEMLDIVLGERGKAIIRRQPESEFVAGPNMQRRPHLTASF